MRKGVPGDLLDRTVELLAAEDIEWLFNRTYIGSRQE
jgi:hypothetical protein